MNYTVTLSGADGRQKYPPHTHTQYELIYYLEGEGVSRTAAGDIPISPGRILLVPPGYSHGTVSKNGFKLIAVKGDFRNRFNFSEPLAFYDNANRDALALTQMIYRNRLSSDNYLLSLVDAYTHFVLKNLHPEDAVTVAVRKIADELSEHFYRCGLSPVTLLKESGYAEDYIRAYFKKVMGKTPTEFLTTLRINHAVYMIETYQNALTLAEICERCGFTNYVYFSKKFKAQVGTSPKDYKNAKTAVNSCLNSETVLR